MTSQVWTLLWLAQVSITTFTLQPPTFLSLTSDHFVHTLTWEPGADASEGVFYQVFVVDERGTLWVPVVGCQHVQQLLFCNLTEAFPDSRMDYFIKVSARLDSDQASAQASAHRNGLFKPVRDTLLDLPLVNISACGQDLCVDLRPSREHLWNIYDSLSYQLKTEDSDGHVQSLTDFRSLSRRTVEDVARGRLYCVSVRFSDSLVPRESNFSQPQCDFTAGGPAPDWWIAVLLGLLVVLVFLVLVLLVYTGFIPVRRKTLPSVLTSITVFRPVRLLRQQTASLSSIEASAHPAGQTRNNGSVMSAIPAGYTGGYQVRVKTIQLSSSSSSSCPLHSELAPSADLDQGAGSEGKNNEMRPELLAARGPGLSHEEDDDDDDDDDDEEEEVQEVDLFSLTFGREVEEKEDQGGDQDREGGHEEADETSVLQAEEVVSAGEQTFIYLRRTKQLDLSLHQ